jgi:hypothetical protein
MDDVPTGKIDSVLSADLLDKALTIEEKNTFSEWLRERWSEKDALMDTFYETGEFPVEKETQRVEMKIGFKDTFDDSVSTLSLSLSLPFSLEVLMGEIAGDRDDVRSFVRCV